MNNILVIIVYSVLLIILIFGYQSQEIKYRNCIFLFFIFLFSLAIAIIISFTLQGYSMCEILRMIYCKKIINNKNNTKFIKVI